MNVTQLLTSVYLLDLGQFVFIHENLPLFSLWSIGKKIYFFFFRIVLWNIIVGLWVFEYMNVNVSVKTITLKLTANSMLRLLISTYLNFQALFITYIL